MTRFDRRWIPIFLLCAYGFVILFFILTTPGLIIHGDAKFPWRIENFVESGRYLFSDHNGSISGIETMSRWNSLSFFTFLFSISGLKTDHLAKFLFVFTTFLSLFSFYYFSQWIARRVIKKKIHPIFLVLVSIFFTSNPWILNQIQAWGFWFAYVCTPLLLMLLTEYLTTRKFFFLFLLVILASILSAGPQFLFYTALLLLIYTALYIALVNRSLLTQGLFYRHILFATGLFFLLSLPWLLPVFSIFRHGLSMTTGYGVGLQDVTASLINEFARNGTLQNIFTGYDQWIYWFNGDRKYRFQSILTLVPFGLFVWILWTVRLRRKWTEKKSNDRVCHWFFWATTLTIFLFATLAYGPNLPGYVAFATWEPVAKTVGFVFRTPYKLSYLVFIGYSILFLFAYARLRPHSRRLFAVALFVYFVCVPFVRTIAYYWTYYVPIEQPKEYQALYNYLDAHESDPNVKILWLAPYMAGWNKNELDWETSFDWNPKRNANHTPETSSRFANVSWYHLTFKNWFSLYQRIDPDVKGSIVYSTGLKSIARDVLAPANIKYVVYHNDIVGAHERGREVIAQYLNESDLILRESFSDKIYLFENLAVKEILSTSNDLPVHYKKIDPTRYLFIFNSDKSETLTFAQSYDPFWLLKIGDQTIVPESSPLNLIQYHIPVTGKVRGEIVYLPQRAYEIGLWISGMTLFGSLIVTLLYLIKRKKDAL